MPVVPFHEVQFPVNYAGGTSSGPLYSTHVTVVDSGYEQRVQMWSNGRLTFQIGYTDNPTGMATIVAFFRARKGRAFGFRFKDWSDYRATAETLVNAGGTTLQLRKTYSDAAGSEIRLIKKPCNNGSLQLYDNAVLKTSGYTVDYTTGVVSIPAGVTGGHVYTWTGEFDVPVRFDSDRLEFIQENVGRRSFNGVGVVELLI